MRALYRISLVTSRVLFTFKQSISLHVGIKIKQNKMIFLSLNTRDRTAVEPTAIKLSEIYGNENVFYDGWSSQPCEGITGKNDQVLAKCEFFFFFVSKNSLTSDLIKLEWQNAIYSAT